MGVFISDEMNEIQNRLQNLEEQGLVENAHRMYEEGDFDVDDIMSRDDVDSEIILNAFSVAGEMGVVSEECVRRAIRIVDNWEEVDPDVQIAFIMVYDDLNNSFGLVCEACDVENESLDVLEEKFSEFYKARKSVSLVERT